MAMSINSGAIAIKKIQASADSDLVKAIQDGEIAIRKKRNDTECGCLRTATRKVHEQLDDSNKYLYYQYDSIKPEVQARPEKPKVQTDGVSSTEASSEVSMAPNQKVTPEVARKIKEMLAKGMSVNKIASKLSLSGKTISRYWKNQGL